MPKIDSAVLSEWRGSFSSSLRVEGVRERYGVHRRLLRELLDALTAEAPFNVCTPFAQVAYVAAHWLTGHRRDLNDLRRHCREMAALADKELATCADRDARTLDTLLRLAEHRQPLTPNAAHADNNRQQRPQPCLRVVVVEARRQWAPTVELLDTSETRQLKLHDGQQQWLPRFEHLDGRLQPDTVLSLIMGADPATPIYIVWEPDFLVNVSELASCYKQYADTAMNLFVGRLGQSQGSAHILRGNLAGALFDEALEARRRGRPMPDYNAVARTFFRRNKLELSTTLGIDAAWHEECRQQLRHIVQAIEALEKGDRHFSAAKAMTETSFVCPQLGLTGRTDMLTCDKLCLVEQKSGKMNERDAQPRGEHYVQVMLYELMLRAMFGVSSEEASLYLLYSRYEPRQGLIPEGGLPDAAPYIAMRNDVVYSAMRHTDANAIESDLDGLTPEWFRQKSVSDSFWEKHLRSDLEYRLSIWQKADRLSRRYFCEMLAFVTREGVLGQQGSRGHADRGFANLWLLDAASREEQGSLVDGLIVTRVEPVADWGSGGRLVRLATRHGGVPRHNFREADVVLLHSHAVGSVPDARTAMAFRGTLVDVAGGHFVVLLRSPQQPELFSAEGRVWALECDRLGSENSGQAKQLSLFLAADQARRDLLLSRRTPIVDEREKPRLDHGPMSALAERCAQAKELFLIVGPPGTGKTSFALMSVVREELAQPGHTLLLSAQTNRAVDEICGKLDQARLDYIRLGSFYGTGEAFRAHLLDESPEDTVAAVRRRLDEVRVVVATVATLCSSPNLLRFKHFHTAIFDEASQLTEPQIVGLLGASLGHSLEASGGGIRPDGLAPGQPAIGRIVLIGDDRQLGPVVQQRGEECRIVSPELRQLGFTDCSEALFTRLLRKYDGNPAVVFQLTNQGRMHPCVAEPANQLFYHGRLTAVGLPHQRGAESMEQEAENREQGAGNKERKAGNGLAQSAAEQGERSAALAAPAHALGDSREATGENDYDLSRRVLYIDSSSASRAGEPGIDGTVAPASPRSSADASGKTNPGEARVVARVAWQVLRRARSASTAWSASDALGIVVPYRAQIALIRSTMLALASSTDERDLVAALAIDTVERFQGSERDVIIYATTVCRHSQMGFLTESRFIDREGRLIDRKLNVALTRAREQTIIVGDRGILARDTLYAALLGGLEGA